MQSIDENSRIQRSTGVVSRRVDDETILVLTGQGQVKVVNEIGGFIWQLAENTPTFGEIIDSITTEYDVHSDQASQDAGVFIGNLVDIGALVIL